MTPEAIANADHHLDEHVLKSQLRPDVCDDCRRTWHYQTPAARVVYTMRRYCFGRGLPDGD